MPRIQEPTEGRIVWYYPTPALARRLYGKQRAAMIVHVWNDKLVNLTVYGGDGMSMPRLMVVLVQPGMDVPDGEYCTWIEPGDKCCQDGVVARCEQTINLSPADMEEAKKTPPCSVPFYRPTGGLRGVRG